MARKKINRLEYTFFSSSGIHYWNMSRLFEDDKIVKVV